MANEIVIPHEKMFKKNYDSYILGFTIGHIVSMLHPLPELDVQEELGILCVQVNAIYWTD